MAKARTVTTRRPATTQPAGAAGAAAASAVSRTPSGRTAAGPSPAGRTASGCPASAASRPPRLRVLHVAGEAVPWIKTGGLADVAGALPRAQIGQGIDARILIPGYPQVLERLRALGPLRPVGPAFGSVFGAARVQVLAPEPGAVPVPVMVLDAPWLFDRDGGPYEQPQGGEWPDAPLRFGLLGWTAAQIAEGGLVDGWSPDVLHVHDWHAALAPVYQSLRPGRRRPSVLTLHNVAFVGAFAPHWMGPLGLPAELFQTRALEYWGRMSFLKGGAVTASALTTVSPTYAREIQSAPAGSGLEGLYQERRDSLAGIVNGIDVLEWNPATDPLVWRPYDAATVTEGKAANRAALMRELDWDDAPDAGPLLGVVSRLSQQKGIDLIVEALRMLWTRPCRLVVLGTGDRDIESMLREFAAANPARVRVVLGFDEALAHRIYAAADAILVPSRFEPCGLSQMYAHRYGALPVVRRTGGLADTVHEGGRDAHGLPLPDDGFVFDEPVPHALSAALHRLLDACAEPQRLHALRRDAMAVDHGWDAPARQYEALYARVLTEAGFTAPPPRD